MLTAPVVACPTLSSGVNPEDEAALLALHELALKTHVEGDIGLLLATQVDNGAPGNSREDSTPTRNDRRRFLRRCLRITEFTAYRDRCTPVVKVSRDGTLGWVAAQIEAWGVAMTPGGKRRVEFIVAWIEIYARRAGEWTAIGDNRGARPDTSRPPNRSADPIGRGDLKGF